MDRAPFPSPGRWVAAASLARLPRDLPGSYVLIVRLAADCRITAGRLPDRSYPAGWYAYTGSARNGLRSRLCRYLRRDRKRHWHIDYLLEHGSIEGAAVYGGTGRLECRLAAGLRERFEFVPRFGAADCRCPGHLFYSPDGAALREAAVAQTGY